MTRARLVVIAVTLAGAALAAYLVVDADAHVVLAALRTAGWTTLLAVSLAHVSTGISPRPQVSDRCQA
jgi:hypothetical protein